MPASTIPASQTGFHRLLLAHTRRYPLWEPSDLYKLLHQAAMGSEHAAPNEAHARLWLEDELGSLGPGPAEPLVDPIAPDGSVVRVHLRPFVQARGDVEALLQAFLRTGRQFQPSTHHLEAYLQAALQLAERGGIPFSRAGLQTFFERMRLGGFPAAHHSAAFAAAYRPAYRVVARAFLPEDLRQAAL